MSKILVIGDIHGSSIWKTIVEKESFDKVIFLGDYFDTFEKISSEDQNQNFLNIVEYCKNIGKDRCILLMGNHDYHYIDWHESYSGKQFQAQMMFFESLTNAGESGLLKLVHIKDNMIFSHAGVTEHWLKEVARLDNPEEINTDKFSMEHLRWNDFEGFSPYGDTISNSPIWVRPNSLQKDALKGYIQVVGHTHVKEITVIKSNNNDSLIICDCLPNQYIIIEENELIKRDIESL